MTSKVVSQGAFFWRVFHVKRCFFLKYSIFMLFVPHETLFFSKNQQFLQLVFRLGYAFLRKLVIFVVSVPFETLFFEKIGNLGCFNACFT